MKPSNRLVLLAAVLAGTSAFAQISPNGGQPASPAAAMMKVTATNPVLHRDANRDHPGIRMLLRMTSNTGSEVPYGADGEQYIRFAQGYGLTGWQAYTGGGVLCMVSSQNGATGLDAINIRYPQNYKAGNWSAGPVRPAMITADFICDGPVAKGDELSVQLKLFLLDHGTWKAADYVFERIKIQ